MCVCFSQQSHYYIYVYSVYYYFTVQSYCYCVACCVPSFICICKPSVVLCQCISLQNTSKGWENDYSPSFNSYILKSLQKCNKVPPKHHLVKYTHTYIHTHSNIVTYIQYCTDAQYETYIFVEMQQHKKKERQRHPQNKILAR